ncbi:MAG: hypothetical protein ACYC5N_01480 [Endomicrobiales bacterium]
MALGWWNTSDDLALTTDKVYEYSFGTGFEVPPARLTLDLRVGQNKLERQAGNSSEKLFASASVFLRPEFLKKLGQRCRAQGHARHAGLLQRAPPHELPG